MAEYVYVVRWQSRTSGMTESGNFDVCYRDEREAEKAMLADMKQTASDWQPNHPETGTRLGRRNENGCREYCAVYSDSEWNDYSEWRIDKLEVA